MNAYVQIPIIVLCFFVLLAMHRWWRCVESMGLTREIGRRAPHLAQRDIVAGVFAMLPFVIGGIVFLDALGIDLPHKISPLFAAFLSIASLLTCVYTLNQYGERFALNWIATRESVLRTIAELNIIDDQELELARAIDTIQRHTKHAKSHTTDSFIDAEFRELKK